MKEALDIESIDVTDDVNALVEGEDLSEEFTSKAKTVFEAQSNPSCVLKLNVSKWRRHKTLLKKLKSSNLN